jgi:multiple sugar transport system substrate-binding protein
MSRLSRREFLRMTAVLAGTGLSGTILGACNPAPVETEESPADTVPAPVDAPVEETGQVRFLERHSSAFGHVWDKAIAVFNDQYPNIEVERIRPPGDQDHREKLVAMVAGGDPPDTHWTTWDWVAEQRQGVYMNLDPYIEADASFDIDIYEDQWIDMWRQPDGVYGLPWDAFIFMIFFNKDLFDEKGVSYPDLDEPHTWQEILEIGKEMTEWDGPRPVTLGTKVWHPGWGMWWEWLRQAGITLYDDEMTKVNLDKPEAWEVLDFFAEWGWKHKVEPTSAIQTDIPLDFPSGKVAMCIMAVCQWSHTRQQCDFEWDVSPFPQWPDTEKNVLGWVCTVNGIADGPNSDNAWNFIKSVCGPEAYVELYKEGMSMPTLKAHTDPIHSAFLESKPPENNTHVVDMARHITLPAAWNNAAWVTVLRIVNDAMGQVYLGEMTAQEAMMEHAVPECNKALSDLREAGSL